MAEDREESKDNEAAVNAYIDDRVKLGVKAALDEYNAGASSRQTSTNDDIKQQRQVIKETLDPIYGDDISNARFEAANAMDMARFYRKHPSALDREEEIEKTFEEARKNGRATSREVIFTYLEGKDYQNDPDKFIKDKQERKKAQLDNASAGQDVGFSGMLRVPAEKQVTMAEFEKMSSEEQEKLFEGITF